ncbi:MAG: metal-dependent hydrolase [Pirellulaceae bacterium]|nr:metal-dependent hydrolase [Pirellulaceae bacterium]
MGTKITWWGHSTYFIETENAKIVVDPYLNENPLATVRAEEVVADYILLTHGHFDHIADALEIAQKNDALIVANFEISHWFNTTHKYEKTVVLNTGGIISFPFGKVEMTHAVHGSQMPDGAYGGSAGGLVVYTNEGSYYFAGDTSLFLDMELIGNRGIDTAFLPIGGQFTMGPEDAVEAVKFLRPRLVVPNHYDTWDTIKQDPHAFVKEVEEKTQAQGSVYKPGDIVVDC